MDSVTMRAPELATPLLAKPLLQTPFHARARAACNTDQFIAWSGYSTVDVFTTVEQEYFAIRNSCSVYDLTPMIKYRITGGDAEAYLNRLVTRDVSRLKIDRVAYAVWCNDAGQVIDDGTIFRFAADEFLLCTAERQLNWLLDSAIGYGVAIEEVTEQIAALSVQGPTSCAVLKAAGFAGVERLKPFEIGRFSLGDVPVTVSRTGFTGDLGYELWMAPADAERVWDELMAAGRSRGIRPIGSAALNLARIEAGFLMPNVDFVSAEKTVHLGRERSPFELGLDWAVDLRKAHFNGKRALVRERLDGPKRRLVGLDVAGQKPAEKALLYASKSCRKQVGAVSSGLWSPTCKRNIALAMLDMPYFRQGSEVWAEIYLCRELVWERRIAKAIVVEKPFFQPERRKLTPPADR
jgi:aminomethyltransferase